MIFFYYIHHLSGKLIPLFYCTEVIMKQEVNVEKIREFILPIIEQNTAELIDLEFKGKKGNQVLRVFVDTEGGITLKQCEQISREISDFLDQKDLISGKYRLEVSSPGIDRPLKTYRDFKRNLSRKVRIEFFNQDRELETKIGTIHSVQEDQVTLEVEKGSIKISLVNIKKAKIIPIW